MSPQDVLALLGVVAAAVYGASLVLLAVQALHSLGLTALFLRHRRTAARVEAEELSRPVPDDADLPHVLVQLPVYDERDVVARVVAAAGRLDWPRDRLTIQLLDDGQDDSVAIGAAAIDALRRAGLDAHHVRRGQRTGFKAGALDHGLTLCPGAAYVAIFDADFVPPADFLRRAIRPLLDDPGLALVQGRWEHRNADQNALTRAQALGIDAHFTVEQAARAWGGLAMNFNGTCGMWRRSAIDDSGGWQHDTLTEDLDLSYRAQLAGWRCTYRVGLAVPGELPADIHAWRAQQFRWAKGSQQTTRKLADRIWRSDWPLHKRVAALLHTSHYAVHPLIVVGLVAAPLAALLAPHPPTWLWPLAIGLVLLGMLTPLVVHAIAHRALGRPWRELARRNLPLAALGTGIALSNARAVAEAWLGRASAFVRTPKRGDGPGSYGARSGPGIAELLAGSWAVFGIVRGIDAGRGWLAPLLFLYAIGFLAVGVLCLRSSARRRAPRRPVDRAAWARLLVAGAVAAGAWVALGLDPSHWVETPIRHAALGVTAGAAMLAALPFGERRGRAPALAVLGFALFFRLAASGLEPSDDLNRYVVEGALVAAGENPYATPPADIGPAIVERVGPAVAGGVNHPEWTAIYPPLALLAQGGITALRPTVGAQRLAATLAELAALGMLALLLRRRGRPVAAILPIAWNPVLIAWTAGEGHNDSLAVLGLAVAMLAWDARRATTGAVAASLAVLCKPFAIAALAARLALRPGWQIAVLPLLAVITALPFLDAGLGIGASLGRFGVEKHHAGVLAPWIRAGFDALGLPWQTLERATAVTLASTFCLGFLTILRRSARSDDPLRVPGEATLWLLVCLPTFHPWYAAVSLPFVVALRSRWLIAWTAMTPLHWLHGLEMDGGVRWAELGWVTTLAHAPLYAAALDVVVRRTLGSRTRAVRGSTAAQ